MKETRISADSNGRRAADRQDSRQVPISDYIAESGGWNEPIPNVGCTPDSEYARQISQVSLQRMVSLRGPVLTSAYPSKTIWFPTYAGEHDRVA